MNFGTEQYGNLERSMHYRFKQPPAGLWTITASNCNGVEAQFMSLSLMFSTLNLRHWFLSSKMLWQSDRNDPYKIRVQINDINQANPLNADPELSIGHQCQYLSSEWNNDDVAYEFCGDGSWRLLTQFRLTRMAPILFRLLAQQEACSKPRKIVRL